MYERKMPHNLDCGLHLLREVLSGKWKIGLLYYIAHGSHRPSQLHQKLSGAARRVIQMQLKQLETHELVLKKVSAERSLKVEYQLTELGESLLPVIAVLEGWGDEHKAQLQRVLRPPVAPAQATSLSATKNRPEAAAGK